MNILKVMQEENIGKRYKAIIRDCEVVFKVGEYHSAFLNTTFLDTVIEEGGSDIESECIEDVFPLAYILEADYEEIKQLKQIRKDKYYHD